jgi:hypothetical protein
MDLIRMIQAKNQVFIQGWGQAWSQVRNQQVWDQVVDQVRNKDGIQVRDKILKQTKKILTP